MILNTISAAQRSHNEMRLSKMSLSERIKYEATKLQLKFAYDLVYRFFQD